MPAKAERQGSEAEDLTPDQYAWVIIQMLNDVSIRNTKILCPELFRILNEARRSQDRPLIQSVEFIDTWTGKSQYLQTDCTWSEHPIGEVLTLKEIATMDPQNQ